MLRMLTIASAMLVLASCAGGSSGSAVRSSSKGDDAFGKADYSQAICDYDEAARQDGRNTHAMVQLGLSWEKLGNAHAALQWYEKVLSISPNGEDGKKAAQRRERLVQLRDWDPSKGPAPAELID